jgi:hypothetical protein
MTPMYFAEGGCYARYMSRLCAKPSCTATVDRWFDFAPADCRVAERGSPTSSTVGLCPAHADRFTVPEGWTLDGLEVVSDVIEPVADAAPRNRSHDRETPWFLTFSDTPIPDLPDRPALRRDDPADDPVGAPTAGSLLHRAFHGPDREIDARRADEAERDSEPVPRTVAPQLSGADELTPRRAKREQTTDYDTIELPFPPRESAQHSAVS